MKKAIIIGVLAILVPFSTKATSTIQGDNSPTSQKIVYFCFGSNNSCYDINGNLVTLVIYNSQIHDISSNYANVNGTIYNKLTGISFSTPQEFFSDSGLNSFNGLVFDTSWTVGTVQAPVSNPSPTPTAPVPTPTPLPTLVPSAPQPSQPPLPSQTIVFPTPAPAPTVVPITCNITATPESTTSRLLTLSWNSNSTSSGKLYASNGQSGGQTTFFSDYLSVNPSGQMINMDGTVYTWKLVFGDTSCQVTYKW